MYRDWCRTPFLWNTGTTLFLLMLFNLYIFLLVRCSTKCHMPFSVHVFIGGGFLRIASIFYIIEYLFCDAFPRQNPAWPSPTISFLEHQSIEEELQYLFICVTNQNTSLRLPLSERATISDRGHVVSHSPYYHPKHQKERYTEYNAMKKRWQITAASYTTPSLNILTSLSLQKPKLWWHCNSSKILEEKHATYNFQHPG